MKFAAVLLVLLTLMAVAPAAEADGTRLVTVHCIFMGDDGDWIWVDMRRSDVTVPHLITIHDVPDVHHHSRVCRIA